jgi:tetratricopeptide (TPR) repeat protein
LSEARKFYEQAFEASSQHPIVTLSYANSVHELGDTDTAVALLQEATNANPQQVQLHQRLNELLWEADRSDEFGDSYQRALRSNQAGEALCVAYAKQMFKAGDNIRSRQVIEELRARYPKSSQLSSLYGQVLADDGDLDTAQSVLMSSLREEFDKSTAQQLCKLHIIQADYSSAQSLIASMQKQDADCQLTWALQSLIWRLTEDTRYRWLCDYESVVRAYTMPKPEGYDSLDAFLQELKQVLLVLHKTQQAPLEQTLLNGTQTAARLLHNPDPVIQSLKTSLESVVSEYIHAMPSNSDHPLYQRRCENFRFSGSWSVRLRPNGFHVNHVHPAGWISSSSYISIPVGADETKREGAIKFGESPLALGDREVIEKVIQPEAGMVALFPSFVWHGTVPFSGSEDDFRLTAPFDVVPVS